jgi:hypothetical protein
MCSWRGIDVRARVDPTGGVPPYRVLRGETHRKRSTSIFYRGSGTARSTRLLKSCLGAHAVSQEGLDSVSGTCVARALAVWYTPVVPVAVVGVLSCKLCNTRRNSVASTTWAARRAGRPADGPLNHKTVKGWVKGKRGEITTTPSSSSATAWKCSSTRTLTAASRHPLLTRSAALDTSPGSMCVELTARPIQGRPQDLLCQLPHPGHLHMHEYRESRGMDAA